MNQTSFSHPMRLARGDFDRYLKGNGIDIGAGPDPLRPPLGSVISWDLPQGDAQYLEGIPTNSLDFVYSSHCLEHMRDVRIAISNWARVLKPKGIFYILIPDYQLYEKCQWPSVNNTDHKASFSLSLTRDKVRRENHFHLSDLKPILHTAGLTLIEAELEDDNYNYNLAPSIDQTLHTALAQIRLVAIKLTS